MDYTTDHRMGFQYDPEKVLICLNLRCCCMPQSVVQGPSLGSSNEGWMDVLCYAGAEAIGV